MFFPEHYIVHIVVYTLYDSYKRIWRLPQFLCFTWSPLVCCFFDTVLRLSLFLLFTRPHCQLCWPDRHYWIPVAETATSIVGLFTQLWFHLSRGEGGIQLQKPKKKMFSFRQQGRGKLLRLMIKVEGRVKKAS